MKISFITPCTRPKALSILYKSILRGTEKTDQIDWYVIYDGRRIKRRDEYQFEKLEPHINLTCETHFNRWSVSGNSQRNRALDQIENGWIYFLDDDNILHPHLFAGIKKELEQESKVGCFLFNQIYDYKRGLVRNARPGKIKAQRIDAAQFLVNSSMVDSSERWIKDKYWADGLFIERIASRYPATRFKYLDRVYAYYNAMSIEELVNPLKD